MMKRITLLVCLGTGVLFAQQAPVSDDFNGTSLNTTLWQVNTPAGGTVSVSNGHAVLNVPSGANHDPNATGTNQSVSILQTIANADFDVVGKFDSTVSQQYQGYGVFVQQDAQNFLRFEVSSDGTTLTMNAMTTLSGNETFIINNQITAGSSLWIRVTKAGNNYTLLTSGDGTNYTSQGVVTASINVAQVGPYAWNYNATPSSAPATVVNVDYFYNLAGNQGQFNGGLMTNGNFDLGSGNWTFYSNGSGNTLCVDTNQALSGYSADISIGTIGNNTQLYQGNLAVAAQQSYTLTFAAKASVARIVEVSLIQQFSPFANYGLSAKQFTMGTSWQTFTVTFTSSNNTPVTDGRLLFQFGTFGKNGDEYWIDNVSLTANTSSGGGGGGGTPSGIGPTGQINPQPSNALNVKTDCGAKGDGSTDDAAAIQTCIGRLATNQTLYFPDSTYIVGSTLHLAANATYLGHSTNGVILHAPTQPQAIADTVNVNPLNITISSMTFDGGNIFFNGDNNGAAYFRVTNCRFQNLTASGDFRAVSFIVADQSGDIGGMTHAQIDHNYFYNLLQGGQTRVNGDPDYDGDVPRAAIWAFGYDQTSIDHNVFDTLYQGIKGCQDEPRILSNFYVGYNIFTSIHRMALEVQGGAGCGHDNSSIGNNSDKVTIEYNLAYNWNDYYWNSFGISWADSPATNVSVNNNIVIGAPYYDSPGVPASHPGIGYEIGGRPLLAYDNLGEGPWGLAVGIFAGSTGSQVYNNWACNVDTGAAAPVFGDEQTQTDTVYSNNFPVYPCNNNGNGGLTATTNISLAAPSLTGSTLTASASVSTINPAIATISFLVDGTAISTKNIGAYSLVNFNTLSANLSYNVSTLPAGKHSLVAVATDVWGNNWNSGSQSFTTTTGTRNPSCTVLGKASVSGGATFGTAQQPSLASQLAGDMGPNEGHPHGVPSSYDFYSSSYIQDGNNIGSNTALVWWGALYVDSGGSPATNTKVAIKNVQLWWKRASTGQWVQGMAPTATFAGEYFSEDFTTDTGTAVPMRTETDGSVSIVTSSGQVAHLYAPYPRVAVDNTDIAAIVVVCDARLVLNNTAGVDDRASAHFLFESGSDPYPATTGAGIQQNVAVGGGKFKYVTNNWRSFAMTTVPQAVLAANPPPIDLTGILP